MNRITMTNNIPSPSNSVTSSSQAFLNKSSNCTDNSLCKCQQYIKQKIIKLRYEQLLSEIDSKDQFKLIFSKSHI